MCEADLGRVHVVSQGDSTTSLAYQNGLFWESVWKHAKNSELRSKRARPNVLMPGDELFIPEISNRDEDVGTEKRHRFKRKGVPEKLNVRVCDFKGRPYANKPYLLEVDGLFSRGQLDPDGFVRVWIAPGAKSGTLRVGERGELARVSLNLGHMDPVTELTGVQARLKNLGFYRGPVDGAESDNLRRAVGAFRTKHGLSDEGGIDDALRSKLVEIHKV
jgi:hypothetical protein